MRTKDNINLRSPARRPRETARSLKMTLEKFIGRDQLKAIKALAQGEEGKFFADIQAHWGQVIDSMPQTYQTDGKGDEAIAYLHYFIGGSDWYITEKDMEEDQLQAFGLASVGGYPELGYISIQDLVKHNVEFDLFFEPQPLSIIKKALG